MLAKRSATQPLAVRLRPEEETGNRERTPSETVDSNRDACMHFGCLVWHDVYPSSCHLGATVQHMVQVLTRSSARALGACVQTFTMHGQIDGHALAAVHVACTWHLRDQMAV